MEQRQQYGVVSLSVGWLVQEALLAGYGNKDNIIAWSVGWLANCWDGTQTTTLVSSLVGRGGTVGYGTKTTAWHGQFVVWLVGWLVGRGGIVGYGTKTTAWHGQLVG